MKHADIRPGLELIWLKRADRIPVTVRRVSQQRVQIEMQSVNGPIRAHVTAEHLEPRANIPKRFNDPGQQSWYGMCRRLAADRNSDFYLPDGSPHHGETFRDMYWHGRNGTKPPGSLGSGTMEYACWMAGVDDRGAKY